MTSCANSARPSLLVWRGIPLRGFDVHMPRMCLWSCMSALWGNKGPWSEGRFHSSACFGLCVPCRRPCYQESPCLELRRRLRPLMNNPLWGLHTTVYYILNLGAQSRVDPDGYALRASIPGHCDCHCACIRLSGLCAVRQRLLLWGQPSESGPSLRPVTNVFGGLCFCLDNWGSDETTIAGACCVWKD